MSIQKRHSFPVQLLIILWQAASLGMDPNAHSSSPYRGGFRGRARGARGFRGRGGGAMPMRSMKLDNRPKKLLVKGTTGNDEALSTVQTHYNVRIL